MYVVHKLLYFVLISVIIQLAVIQHLYSYMDQSFLVLSTKSTNHNIDYNHYSNQFKRLTLHLMVEA